MDNKNQIDYYDKIADALEIISGDNSHINEVDKNMDYYKRIADALENISKNPSPSSSKSNDLTIVNFNVTSDYDDSTDTNTFFIEASKTPQEVYNDYSNKPIIGLLNYENTTCIMNFYNDTFYSSIMQFTQYGKTAIIYIIEQGPSNSWEISIQTYSL